MDKLAHIKVMSVRFKRLIEKMLCHGQNVSESSTVGFYSGLTEGIWTPQKRTFIVIY